jgi:hypothetical protein
VIVIQDYSSVHESRDGDLDFLCLLGAIHRVCSVGGFVAGFFCKPVESSSDVFAWVWDRMPNEEFQQLWKTVQKCSLASFDLQLLVDDDIYKEFTLCELHQRVLCGSSTSRVLEDSSRNDVEGRDDIFAEGGPQMLLTTISNNRSPLVEWTPFHQ